MEGNFTVEADRSEVVRLGQIVVESKIRYLQKEGHLEAALCLGSYKGTQREIKVTKTSLWKGTET